MNISSFFIERPIFASVLAIILTVAGLLAMPVLPNKKKLLNKLRNKVRKRDKNTKFKTK